MTLFHNPQRGLELFGLALVAIAIAWWAVVYGQVINNTSFPLQRTLPCLLHTSDRCSLAMSLCKDWHFLGIKRYSAGLLWLGGGVSLLALTLPALRERFGNPRKEP